jgi:hypothetical protein
MENNLILRVLTSPYNDNTRGSVLDHEDVDGNFIFLKGNLIKSGITQSNNLILQSLNGETVTIPLNFTGTTSGGTNTGITALTFNTHNTIIIKDATGGTFTALVNYLSGLTVTGSVMNGFSTLASGNFSHAEGSGTTAVGIGSHAEGFANISFGDFSHAEGSGNTSTGIVSHAEGILTESIGLASHAEGFGTQATGVGSHAEGIDSFCDGEASHAEGFFNSSSGQFSHSEGYANSASGIASHAEGKGTVANGDYSHSEGTGTTTAGNYSHAEGFGSVASGIYSHAEGLSTSATTQAAHAEGQATKATAQGSHAEGNATIASGQFSHSQGISATASGFASHAEGSSTVASGFSSHAEGFITIAGGPYTHTEGSATTATGIYSHAEGALTLSSGAASHAEGLGTIASGNFQHVSGNYNSTGNTTSLFTIGNGTSNANRSDLALFYSTGITFNAPLKLTPTTLLSTPENGAIEYDGKHLYTTFGSTRYSLDNQITGMTFSGSTLKLLNNTGGTLSTTIFASGITGTTFAVEGLSVLNDGKGKTVVLGQDFGDNTYPAVIDNLREIPLDTGAGAQIFITSKSNRNIQTAISPNVFQIFGYSGSSNPAFGLILNDLGLGLNITYTTSGWTIDGQANLKITSPVGIHSTGTTAYLQLGAGSTGATTAPLKFESGQLLITPENGTMEHDGSNLYFTISGFRYPLTQTSISKININTTVNGTIQTYIVDTSGGSVTLTVNPTTLGNFGFSVKKKGTDSNSVTISMSSGSIYADNGAQSFYTFSSPGAAINIKLDGTDAYVL